MFAEAEAEQAVLLLDEADSFLRSRRLAERTHELGEVNEMLQGMERFGGIFICTTSLFEEFDETALRRFTFKIRFRPLTPEQRERTFVAEALQGNSKGLSPERRARLGQLDALAAGDIAGVKRQTEVLAKRWGLRIPVAVRSRALHEARGSPAPQHRFCELLNWRGKPRLSTIGR